MKIYIASSWKNQHGVELLTTMLRDQGHEVISWIENNFDENPNGGGKQVPFEEWVNSSKSNQSFEFDTHGAMTCDLFIYYGNAGKDAAAECGMCYGRSSLESRPTPMFALASKGEDFGLMRKMFNRWFDRVEDLLKVTAEARSPNPHSCFGRRPHRMDFDDADEYQLRLDNYLDWEEKNDELKRPDLSSSIHADNL